MSQRLLPDVFTPFFDLATDKIGNTAVNQPKYFKTSLYYVYGAFHVNSTNDFPPPFWIRSIIFQTIL